MALGTFTLSVPSGGAPSSPSFRDHVSVPGDSSYPTGGSAFDAAFDVATKHDRTIDDVLDVTANATYYLAYDKANGKLKAFARATGLEVTATTDLSGTTFKLLVLSH